MKLTRDLQKLIDGEVFEDKHVLDYFSTDGSVFKLTPKAVVYPRSSQDVARLVTYLAQQTSKGKRVSLVAKGKGTDQAGGALGDGVAVVFPAHMNKLIELDKNKVVVQPGIIYGDLQRTLYSHGRFLPPYPSSIDFSTIGGAVANNACGEKTLKYGSTREYVKRLKVVLADGREVEVSRISARELKRKKGQTDLEGEIYRKLDGLLIDNDELIKANRPKVSKNSAGYNLWGVKGQDGSFDLSKIITGSQGTLGVITEITLKTAEYNENTTLLVGYFDSLESAGEAVLKLEALAPSAMELVDYHLLNFLQKHKPGMLDGLVPPALPKIVLLIEFDNTSRLQQTLKLHRAQKILAKLASSTRVAKAKQEQERLWQVRHSAAAVIWMNQGTKKALPIIEDGVVPIKKLPQFLDAVYALLDKYGLEIAVWGHAGDANFHMQPFLDLGKVEDQGTVFKVMDEFYAMVMEMGGSTCGEHNDGLLRAPYLKKLYGKDMYSLFGEVKHIFDPQGILNPNIKLGITRERQAELLRREYSMSHLYDHMPRL